MMVFCWHRVIPSTSNVDSAPNGVCKINNTEMYVRHMQIIDVYVKDIPHFFVVK